MSTKPFADFHAGRMPNVAEKCVIAASKNGTPAQLLVLERSDRVISASLVAALATNRFKDANDPDWTLHPNGLRLRKV